MQGCSGKHVLPQRHGDLGALCAWLRKEVWSWPAPVLVGEPGWEGCGAGEGSSPCLGVGAAERQKLRLCQRPGRGLSEAQALQPDVLQRMTPGKGHLETGKAAHGPSLENSTPAFLL